MEEITSGQPLQSLSQSATSKIRIVGLVLVLLLLSFPLRWLETRAQGWSIKSTYIPQEKPPALRSEEDLSDGPWTLRKFSFQGGARGPSCNFLPDWTRVENGCAQDESCTVELQQVCLTRKDPELPAHNTTMFEYGRPYLEVSGKADLTGCVKQIELAEAYGSSACWRMGKRLPLSFEGLGEGLGKDSVTWRPKTFVIYCAQEGCDWNFFHGVALAYYSTYVALRNLGLESLEGIHVEFYECQSGKSGEVMNQEQLEAARDRHFVFLKAFKPASISFLDIALQEESQFLGCYESVVFVGNSDWPWHCRTKRLEPDPALTGFADLVAKSLGFQEAPSLPQEDHLLYFKRSRDTVRTLINADEIEAAFPIAHTVYAGANASQSYREQLTDVVRTVRGASIIFGGHGAGLTNVLFAPPGAVLIEVTNCYFRLPLYRNLAVLTGKHHIELVVNVDEDCKSLTENSPLDYEHHGDHVTVDLDDLARVIRQAQVLVQKARKRAAETATSKSEEPRSK